MWFNQRRESNPEPCEFFDQSNQTAKSGLETNMIILATSNQEADSNPDHGVHDATTLPLEPANHRTAAHFS